MTGTTLDFDMILRPEDMACRISGMFVEWDNFRHAQLKRWEDIHRYVFATSTKDTANAINDWSNSTTLPKLCQIRDNIYANYMAAMFPNRKWLHWEGDNQNSEEPGKKEAIESYMSWVIDRNEYYETKSRLVLDWIDYGNCFSTVEWCDNRVVNDTPGELNNPELKLQQYGYVGPKLVRIAPEDIVFNPTAPNFASTPKIIRSLMTMGEAKKLIEKESADFGVQEDAKTIWDYLVDVRNASMTANYAKSQINKDVVYQIAGFGNFRDYLRSNMVEVLTFYGDIFDYESKTLHENHVIKVFDRHRILSKRPSPTFFGQIPIFHVGWRYRPNNLWAMGPLENLVGMQYRIDHLENMRADIHDLIAYPVLKTKGYVGDFKWAPMERIDCGDDGDVQMVVPDANVLQADNQILMYEQKMEEIAGSPKEAAGFRTPGEKTMYEVQRLENAASRIFQSKIMQYEREGTENEMNAMLESARRNMSPTTVRVFDDQLGIANFMSLTPADITGQGRIKPIAARHFAEQATHIQNLNNFFSSSLGQDPDVRVHFSGQALAQMMEGLLNLKPFNVYSPFVRISEQADAQSMSAVHQENMAMELQTPAGVAPDDFDL